ncbi:hypothetical protein [Microvirga puerhi]|uniref:Uncharacterized protein n=1 Tax=Microvirga puerhi TaxID=2876078 RepID=A0ABS7VLM8_9HYPH|nr:hypothetical protein [Microvirga puerhi]MBZ6076066.1 hypothetical protein [Microvirga puerhi]
MKSNSFDPVKDFSMPGIRFAFLTALIALCGTVPAFAQSAPNTSSSNPLVLTVRPSGYDADAEAQARQERLLKRMEQADYSVRSICVSCGDGWKHQTYAPFNPLQSLRSAPLED